MGEEIFVQSDGNRKNGDNFRSLKDRFDKNPEIKKAANNREMQIEIACKTWYDVRAFGQVFAFKKGKKSDDGDDGDSVSIGIRGPVTIQNAASLQPVSVYSQQITKSVNLETDPKDPDKKGSDTMGMKHRVDFGIYVTYGSISCQLAEKTGFSNEDADILLAAMKSLFVNDESSARPSGSMKVEYVVWWKHNCKNGQYSSSDVHESICVKVDEESKKPIISVETPLAELEPSIYTGENR
jgi:CRISPR-associated protein Csd2